MNRPSRLVIVPIAILALVAGAGCGQAGANPSTPTAGVEPSPSQTADTTFVADLDVGGRSLHIICIGPQIPGDPTVVFEHGLGGDSRVWAQVLTKLSENHRGCSYDRAGVGMSEPAPGSRTTRDQVGDLQALLDAAGIEPPYVLAAHSSGAYNALIHAVDRPDDVEGIVLVDPRPPSASSRFLAALPPESATESETIRQYRDDYTVWEADPAGNPEGLDLIASAAQADAARDLGSIPLIVLAADGDDGEGSNLDAPLALAFETIWTELQEELAGRSDAGVFERVSQSTHDMPADRPDAIVDAIARILAD